MGEDGKKILYSIVIVHIGGLTSCTLLEFLVRPALRQRCRNHITSSTEDDVEFADEKHTQTPAAEPVAA